MKQIMEELGILRIEDNKSAKVFTRKDIETKISRKLDENYLMFLEYIKDASLFERKPKIRLNSGFLTSVLLMFGLRDDENGIVYNFFKYKRLKFLPKNKIPIGTSPGGDLFCYNIDDSSIYYWRHDEPNSKTNPEFLSDGFISFLNSFVEDNDETIEKIDDEIVDFNFDF